MRSPGCRNRTSFNPVSLRRTLQVRNRLFFTVGRNVLLSFAASFHSTGTCSPGRVLVVHSFPVTSRTSAVTSALQQWCLSQLPGLFLDGLPAIVFCQHSQVASAHLILDRVYHGARHDEQYLEVAIKSRPAMVIFNHVGCAQFSMKATGSEHVCLIFVDIEVEERT